MMTVLIITLLIGATLILAGCQATRAGYETAPYQVVRSDHSFELREYPALVVVEAPVVGSGNAADGGFTRLFRFITGGNEAKQKIAMTTPVFMGGSESNTTMAFVMPAKLRAGEVPMPADGSLKVRELEAGRFAVLRFNGGRKERNEVESLHRLQTWMTAEGLSSSSPPVYAYFDPPWTPSFLRRNEVMLRLENVN